MKQLFRFATTLIVVSLLTTAAQADVTVGYGDVPIDPGGVSQAQQFNVLDPILGFDIAFDFSASLDGSWSSDYYATIIDPSGDVFRLGDGLGFGDLDYDLGVATGTDGSQKDSSDAGSFGTFFSLAQIQALSPTFGEAGVYQAFFADGWAGGAETEILGSATITVSTQAIPEPASGLVLVGLTGVLFLRRRR